MLHHWIITTVTVHKGAYRGNEQPEHRANTDVSPEPAPELQLHAGFGSVILIQVTGAAWASRAA